MSTDCPFAGDRRDFLRLVAGLGVFGSIGVSPDEWHRFTIRFAPALSRSGSELTYPVPNPEIVSIDTDNLVIISRHERNVWAFSLKCPHEGNLVEWIPEEDRFRCPKHKSKYYRNGNFNEGRATRGLDRHPIRRDQGTLIVDTSVVYRQDDDTMAWIAATVELPRSS